MATTSRSPAQRAATKRMIAANKAARRVAPKSNARPKAASKKGSGAAVHEYINTMDGPEKGIIPDSVKVVRSQIQRDGIHRWRKVTLRFKNPKDPVGYVFVHVAARDGIGGGLMGSIPARSPAIRMAILNATDRACTGRNG